MSWASHNPEKYDEITRNGMVSYLSKLLGDYGFCPDDTTLEMLVEVVQQDVNLRPAYETIRDLAHRHISDAEADHWGQLADQAHERQVDEAISAAERRDDNEKT